MPHIIAEHSEGLSAPVKDLLSQLHNSLAGQNTVSLEAIKTRALPIYHAVIGNGEAQTEMLHITLKLLPGRSDELKKKMAQDLFDLARAAIPDEKSSISVEVMELHKESYTK